MTSNQHFKVILFVLLGIMFLVVVILRSNLPAVAVLKDHILKRLNVEDKVEVKPSAPVVEKVKSSVQNIPVLKFFSKTAKNMGDSVGKKLATLSNKNSQIAIKSPLDIISTINKKLETMKKSITKLLDLIINFPHLSGSLLFRLFISHNDTKPTSAAKPSLEECTDIKKSKTSGTAQTASWYSSSTSSSKSKSANDHMSINFKSLPESQQTMIREVTGSAVYKDKAIAAAALESGIVMDEFLAYRYFAAIDWAPKYHGKRCVC